MFFVRVRVLKVFVLLGGVGGLGVPPLVSYIRVQSIDRGSGGLPPSLLEFRVC